MLDERVIAILAEMCESLLESSEALVVSLVDWRSREIVHAGAELPAELELPEPAQDIVHRRAQGRHDRRGEHSRDVGKHQVFALRVAVGLLVVVFGNRSSLGLVRRCACNMQREIEELLASATPPDNGGPSGAAAAAVAAAPGAWPPTRRNRGSC